MVYKEILPTTSNTKANGVFTALGIATISAPASEVWDAVIAFNAYPEWNQYTPYLKPPSGSDAIAVGDLCELTYRFTTKIDPKPCPVRIMDLQPDEMYLCWRGVPPGVPEKLICGEKVQKVTKIDEETCKYEVWETQSGPAAYTVKWTLGSKLDAMNQGIADGMKEYIECKKALNG